MRFVAGRRSLLLLFVLLVCLFVGEDRRSTVAMRTGLNGAAPAGGRTYSGEQPADEPIVTCARACALDRRPGTTVTRTHAARLCKQD